MDKIFDIFKSRSSAGLLELFISRQGSEFNQSEIVAQSGFSRANVRRWLAVLERSGIIKKRSMGNAQYYSLDGENPVVKQVKVLFTVAKLADFAAEFGGAEVYLYGSAARGEDMPKSDIDVLIVGKISLRTAANWAGRASRYLGRKVSPMVRNPLEYAMISRKDRVFYENVDKNKIRVA